MGARGDRERTLTTIVAEHLPESGTPQEQQSHRRTRVEGSTPVVLPVVASFIRVQRVVLRSGSPEDGNFRSLDTG